MIDDNDLWLLSFYRLSEINGSLFFGQLARSLPPGPIQCDMVKQYADEAAHAWYWTRTVERLGAVPKRIDGAYQDQYLAAVGLPVNVMEVLAITHVFERRVMNQYSRHLHTPGIQPEIAETLRTIMEDEKWHLKWVHEALKGLEPEYGKDTIARQIEKCSAADAEIYRKLRHEHGDRLRHILGEAHA